MVLVFRGKNMFDFSFLNDFYKVSISVFIFILTLKSVLTHILLLCSLPFLWSVACWRLLFDVCCCAFLFRSVPPFSDVYRCRLVGQHSSLERFRGPPSDVSARVSLDMYRLRHLAFAVWIVSGNGFSPMQHLRFLQVEFSAPLKNQTPANIINNQNNRKKIRT